MAQRFTVFDVLEAKGAFRKNPANISAQDEQGASLYRGPVQYPKMVYHPMGEERIIQEGEVIVTPLGPKLVMQQRELIWEIVNTPEEEAQMVADGWHLHPADAIRASGKTAPPTGADHVIAQLKRQIEELQAQAARLTTQQVQQPESLPLNTGALVPPPPPEKPSLNI